MEGQDTNEALEEVVGSKRCTSIVVKQIDLAIGGTYLGNMRSPEGEVCCIQRNYSKIMLQRQRGDGMFEELKENKNDIEA